MVKKSLISIIILNLFVSLSYASEILSTALTSSKKINIQIYNIWLKEEIKFKDTDDQRFTCDLTQELAVLKAIVPINYKINFYTKAGFINSEIERDNNRYSGKTDFSLYGGGIKYIFFPDTIVTPAITLDLGVTFSSNYMDKRKINNLKKEIDTKLETLEYQGALIISKKLNLFEPFGGIKFFTSQIEWENREGQSYKGINNTDVGSFIGSKVFFYPLVSLVLEMDFIGEVGYGIGLDFKF